MIPLISLCLVPHHHWAARQSELPVHTSSQTQNLVRRALARTSLHQFRIPSTQSSPPTRESLRRRTDSPRIAQLKILLFRQSRVPHPSGNSAASPLISRVQR